MDNLEPQVVETDEVDPGDSTPTVGSFIWELVKVLALALVIILPLRLFVAEPFIVSGSSMVPNFHDREYLIVDKVSYRLHPPQRGDVIVFKYPRDPNQYFIKRIAGLPGEQIKISQRNVVIINKEFPNGKVLDEPYVSDPNSTLGREEVVSLGSSEYFVLGDNRLASSDSRVWGVLPKDKIVGKVWLRVFPLSKAGLIKHLSP